MLRNIIVFVVVVVFLLAEGPQAYSTARSWLGLNDWNWWGRDAVTSTERAQELAAKGLHEQLISFSDGMSSLEYKDGGKPESQRYDIYAIGVGQITLNDPEDRGIEKVTVTGMRVPAPTELSSADALPTQPITGQFNNVLLFDRRSGEITKLFDTRIAISLFQYGWRTKRQVLVIFGTDRDSDKNGKIDDADLHDIYVYTFDDHKMTKVQTLNTDAREVIGIPDADYIVVKAFVDHDKDGTSTEYRHDGRQPDPATLIRVDLETFVATPFVPDTMTTALQNTLDGAKPAQPGPTPAKQ